MKNVILEQELEKILVTNWHKFLDKKEIIRFVLSSIIKYSKEFNTIQNKKIKKNNFQVLLSRFQIVENGFIVWADFAHPIENKTAIGTTEFVINNNGSIKHIQTIGTIYS